MADPVTTTTAPSRTPWEIGASVQTGPVAFGVRAARDLTKASAGPVDVYLSGTASGAVASDTGAATTKIEADSSYKTTTYNKQNWQTIDLRAGLRADFELKSFPYVGISLGASVGYFAKHENEDNQREVTLAATGASYQSNFSSSTISKPAISVTPSIGLVARAPLGAIGFFARADVELQHLISTGYNFEVSTSGSGAPSTDTKMDRPGAFGNDALGFKTIQPGLVLSAGVTF